jgi:hypothetical protein
MEKWALIVALIFANGAMIFGFLGHADLIQTIIKSVVIFAVMYVLCRIVISTWDKVGIAAEDTASADDTASAENTASEEPEEIKTTMDMLDDLDEKGIKVTYNPLDEGTDPLNEGTDPLDERNEEQLPGQINMDAMSQQEGEEEKAETDANPL